MISMKLKNKYHVFKGYKVQDPNGNIRIIVDNEQHPVPTQFFSKNQQPTQVFCNFNGIADEVPYNKSCKIFFLKPHHYILKDLSLKPVCSWNGNNSIFLHSTGGYPNPNNKDWWLDPIQDNTGAICEVNTSSLLTLEMGTYLIKWDFTIDVGPAGVRSPRAEAGATYCDVFYYNPPHIGGISILGFHNYSERFVCRNKDEISQYHHGDYVLFRLPSRQTNISFRLKAFRANNHYNPIDICVKKVHLIQVL